MTRFVLIAILFLFSCSQKTKVPESILPPDRMDKLLMDMIRAEEFFTQKQSDSAFRDSLTRFNLYRSVLEANKTNKEDFKKSFIYYESHPDLLKTVLDSMHSRVNKTTDTAIKIPPRLIKPSKK